MFSAIIWVEYSKENREVEFPPLFDFATFSRLSAEFIQTVVMKNPLVAQNNSCLKSIIETLTTKIMHGDSKFNSSMESGFTIVSLGGEHKKSVIEFFNVSGKLKISYPDLPKAMVFGTALSKRASLCIA